MLDQTAVGRANLYIVLLIGLSLFSLWRCTQSKRLLSCVGGLHANTLVMYGMGPIYYINTPLTIDRLPQEELIAHIAGGVEPLLYGYLIWAMFEPLLVRGHALDVVAVARTISFNFQLVFTGLALVGYVVSQFEFAQSGVGTLFPLLKNLFYPMLLLALLKIGSQRNVSENAFSLGVFGMATVLAFLSPWRSELIMLVMYLVLSFWHRFTAIRTRLAVVVAAVVGALVLIPFVEYKKREHAHFEEDPLGALVASQAVGIDERFSLIGEFSAYRLNALRELAHISWSLNATISLQYGDTYLECLYQLVPRVIWPDKPSYNNIANRVLPRKVGLVGSEDEGTSWGVCLFAEMAYNYPVGNLIWFVPLLFFIANRLDWLAVRMFAAPPLRLICFATLFGMSFCVVGAAYASTYVVWSFIVLKAVELTLHGRLDP